MGGPGLVPEEGRLTCTGISQGDNLQTGRKEVGVCQRPGGLRRISGVVVMYYLGGEVVVMLKTKTK